MVKVSAALSADTAPDCMSDLAFIIIHHHGHPHHGHPHHGHPHYHSHPHHGHPHNGGDNNDGMESLRQLHPHSKIYEPADWQKASAGNDYNEEDKDYHGQNKNCHIST